MNGEWDNQYVDDDRDDTGSSSNREVKSKIYTVELRDSTTSDEKDLRVSKSARKSVFQRQTERLSVTALCAESFTQNIFSVISKFTTNKKLVAFFFV